MAGLDLGRELDLEQLGLPVSNTENKWLEAEVQKKQKDLSANEERVDQHKERIQAISDHLKNVKQELHHTQVFDLIARQVPGARVAGLEGVGPLKLFYIVGY